MRLIAAAARHLWRRRKLAAVLLLASAYVWLVRRYLTSNPGQPGDSVSKALAQLDPQSPANAAQLYQ